MNLEKASVQRVHRTRVPVPGYPPLPGTRVETLYPVESSACTGIDLYKCRNSSSRSPVQNASWNKLEPYVVLRICAVRRSRYENQHIRQ
eukprot:2723515-Rhodomonas_salina.1